jgi:hypothetical protein
MSSVNELYNGFQPQSDVKGSRDVRRFLVVADSIENNPLTVPGLPNFYELHPRISNMKVDSKSVETKIGPAADGGFNYIVAVNYSNDFSFRLTNKPPVRETNYKSFSLSFNRREQSIPYFLGEDVTIPGDSGNVTKFIWFQHSITADDAWNVTYSRKVNVSSWTLTETKKVMAQKGKYHYLDGTGADPVTFAKFMGASLSHDEADRYTVTYSWIQDSGNGFPNLALTVNAIFQPIGPTVRREPFQAYVIEPQTDATPPVIKCVNTYNAFAGDIDQAGGNNLPGSPLS